MFLREPGQVLPREMLHQKVWGAGRDATYNNIEVYLTLVRRKLRAVGSKAELISERGNRILSAGSRIREGALLLLVTFLLFFLPFELLPFPCFLIWCRPETGDRFEKGNGSRPLHVDEGLFCV